MLWPEARRTLDHQDVDLDLDLIKIVELRPHDRFTRSTSNQSISS